MELNNLDIALIVIILLGAIVGYIRGILFSVLRFLRTAVGMFLCFYFSSYYTQPVYNSLVKPRLLKAINEKIVLSGNIDEIISNLNNYVNSLPSFLAAKFNVSSLNISSNDIAQSILTNVFEPFAIKITRIILFLLIFIVFFAATGIILFIMKKKYDKDKKDGKKSTIKKTDKAFGVVFGALRSLIIVFSLISIALLFANPEGDSSFSIAVNNSVIINFLKNVNPFNVITEGLL